MKDLHLNEYIKEKCEAQTACHNAAYPGSGIIHQVITQNPGRPMASQIEDTANNRKKTNR